MGRFLNKSCYMTIPQPFQYQGSQRALAPLILQSLPISTIRRVEPFLSLEDIQSVISAA